MIGAVVGLVVSVAMALLKAEEAEVRAAVADHGIAGRSASSNFVDFENSVVTTWAAGLSASILRDATV